MIIKKGDIVGRKSYNKDIYFIVDKIIRGSLNKQIAVLKGINIRVMADAPIEDLEIITKKDILNSVKNYEIDFENRIKSNIKNMTRQRIYTGKILHLDGDRKYSEKSLRYYNKMGLNAVVKNIVEYRQPNIVVQLLRKYNPDILIITGHDAMIRNGTNYSNIYNYRNSRHFISTVKNARTWGINSDKLTIFARSMPKFLRRYNFSSEQILHLLQVEF